MIIQIYIKYLEAILVLFLRFQMEGYIKHWGNECKFCFKKFFFYLHTFILSTRDHFLVGNKKKTFFLLQTADEKAFKTFKLFIFFEKFFSLSVFHQYTRL